MSDIEILDKVINTLDNISVPAKYIEQIGIPISNCSNMLKILNKAVKDMLQKKEEESATATAEPVEVLPEEVPAKELDEDEKK